MQFVVLHNRLIILGAALVKRLPAKVRFSLASLGTGQMGGSRSCPDTKDTLPRYSRLSDCRREIVLHAPVKRQTRFVHVSKRCAPRTGPRLPPFFHHICQALGVPRGRKKKKKKKVQQISVNTEVYMSRVIFAQTLTTSLLLKPFHLKEFHLIKTLPLRDRPRRI